MATQIEPAAAPEVAAEPSGERAVDRTRLVALGGSVAGGVGTDPWTAGTPVLEIGELVVDVSG